MRRFSTVLYDVVRNYGLLVHTIVDTSTFFSASIQASKTLLKRT